MTDPSKQRVLAISSSGGHWVELLRLKSAWEGCDVTYATTQEDAFELLDDRDKCTDRKNLHVIAEASRWNKLKLARQLLQILFIILRTRPHTIVSTGAAAGYFAIWLGRRFGARTVWVDSLANAEELSLSGQMAGRHADLWLTQWPHLARPEGPQYNGGVM